LIRKKKFHENDGQGYLDQKKTETFAIPNATGFGFFNDGSTTGGTTS